MQVRIRGLSGLLASLRRLDQQLDGLDMSGPAQPIAAAARARAPKRTGRLAAEIHVVSTGPGKAEVVSGLIYSGPIHNGWPGHHIEPNPYLTDGAEDADPAVGAATGRVVEGYCRAVRGA